MSTESLGPFGGRHVRGEGQGVHKTKEDQFVARNMVLRKSSRISVF